MRPEIIVEGITREEIRNIEAQFRRFASTYWWTPPPTASARRAEECRNSNSWSFSVNGEQVACSVEVSCSCKNYYATREIWVGAERKKMMVPYLAKLLAEGKFNDSQEAL